MNNEEARKHLVAKLECLERDTSGVDEECNKQRCKDCSLGYEQGTMGEQIESMKKAIVALERYEDLKLFLKDDLEKTLSSQEEFLAWLEMAINALKREQQFLEAGYKNDYVEFMIGGRKFRVRELVQ